MELFKLFGTVLIDNDPANRKLEDTDARAEKVGNTLARGTRTAAKWGAGIAAGAAAAGIALFGLVNKVTTTAAAIDSKRKQVGVTSEALQEYVYAADQAGVAQDSMERALGRLNQRIGLAERGNEKYQKSLRELGVTSRDTSEAFMQSIEALHQMEDADLRAAAAADLYGTQLARQLMPIIEEGGEALLNLRNRAHEVGAVMDQDATEASNRFQSALADIRHTVTSVAREIALQALPWFEKFATWTADNIPKVWAVFQFIGEVIEIVFRHARRVMEPFFDTVKDFLGTAWDFIVDIAGTAWEWIVGTTWQEKMDDMKALISTAWIWTVNIAGKAWDWIVGTTWQEKLDAMKALISTAWIWTVNIAGKAWEWLEEKAPWLTSTLSAIWDYVKDAWTWTVGLGGRAWTWLEENAPWLTTALEALWDLIKTAWSWTVDTAGTAWDWLKDLTWADVFEAIWGWIKDTWSWTVSLAGDAWSWLTETTWAEKVEDVKTLLGGTWQWTMNLLGGAWDWIELNLPWLAVVLETIWENLKHAYEWTLDMVGQGWQWFTGTTFKEKWETLKTLVQDGMRWILTKAGDAWEWIEGKVPDQVWEWGEARIQAIVELGGDTYEFIKNGFETGDWSGVWGVLADVWRAGMRIAITLGLTVGTVAAILSSIKTGLGVVAAGLGSLGLPGIIGALSVLIMLAEAGESGSYEKFGRNLMLALAAGIGIGTFTRSPKAGVLAFTIALNLELGDLLNPEKGRDAYDAMDEAMDDWIESVEEKAPAAAEILRKELDMSPLLNMDFDENASWFERLRKTSETFFDSAKDGFFGLFSAMEESEDSTKDVSDAFEELYDDVVGNSYIPDMVKGIAMWMGPRLKHALSSVATFTQGVKDDFRDMYMDVVGGSTVPSMVDEIGDAIDRLKERLAQPVTRYVMDVIGSFEYLEDEVVETITRIADKMDQLLNSIADRVGGWVGEITRMFWNGTADWYSIFHSLAGVIGDVFGSMFDMLAKEIARSLIVQNEWIVSTLAGIATTITGYLSQAFAALTAFYWFLGPGAPAAAAVTIGAAIAAIAAIGGSAIRGLLPSPPDAGGGAGGGGRAPSAGRQVSEITGPTRDLLTDLLTPLASLNSLTGIGERIYTLLDDRMPVFGAGMAMAGAGGYGGINVTVASGAVQITTRGGDRVDLDDDTMDEIARRLARELAFEIRGAGG